MDSPFTYQSLVALYRPVNEDRYERITGTVVISKRTPAIQVPLAEPLHPGFNCDSLELKEHIEVLEGDVIGACIYQTRRSRRLDLVSSTGIGFNLMSTGSTTNNCENGVLPAELAGLNEDSDPVILHVYAEIGISSV